MEISDPHVEVKGPTQLLDGELSTSGFATRWSPVAYFASPFTSLNTASVYRGDGDSHLTDAYIRTSISHYLHEAQSQGVERQQFAGCICFGTRLLRTSRHTAYAFHKNPNQFIFNMGWVNTPGFLPENQRLGLKTDDTTVAEFLDKTKHLLCLLLPADHPTHNLILDVSTLIGLKEIPAHLITYMIRDAIIEAEFRCESIRIFWPTTVPQSTMDTLFTFM